MSQGIIASIPPHRRFAANNSGRDFFVGDLHGKYAWLNKALEYVGFNPQSDRLFSVGDLIDRGEDSLKVLQLCTEPWFFPVLGNHEHMLLTCKDEEWMRVAHWYPNGGEWWESTNKKERKLAEELILANFAVTQTIDSPSGDIGMVHADVPESISWSSLTKNQSLEEEHLEYCLWSRRKISRYIEQAVADVRLVVLGHTPLPEPLMLGNCLFLDTGAGHYEHRFLPDPKLSLATLEGSLKGSGSVRVISVNDRGAKERSITLFC